VRPTAQYVGRRRAARARSRAGTRSPTPEQVPC
jgi:hypothetical protein